MFLGSSLSSSNELKAIFGCGCYTAWSHGPVSSAVMELWVLGTHRRVQTSTMPVAFRADLQPRQDLHQRMGKGGTEAIAAARAQRLDTGGDNLPSQTSCESKEDKNQGWYISPTYPHTHTPRLHRLPPSPSSSCQGSDPQCSLGQRYESQCPEKSIG